MKLLLGIEVITLFLGIKSFNNKPSEKLDDIKLLQAIHKNSLYAVMVDDGSGNYTEGEEFPIEGYIFNKEKSKCIDSNGNTLEDELNFVNGNIEVTLGKTAFCYLYFDKNSETIITITASNGVESYQVVQFDAEDEDGIAGVYYGMDNPEDTEVNYSEISDGSTTKSVSFYARAYGIYYFSVKDIHGMVTTTSREFFETKFSVENGTVTPTSVITLKGNSFALPTPRANPGYTISTTWHGNGTTYESGSTYTPTTNSTLTANSSQNRYNVTLTITNGKTTSVNPQAVLHGSSVSFAITPNTGYDLVLASDTCSGTLSGSTYTVSNVTSAKNCAITLKKKTYSVKIAVTNGSTSSTNPQTVEHGGSAKFTISAKSGYQLSLSSNGCGGTLSGSTYTISNITSDKTCTITLKKRNPAGEYIKNYNPTGLESTARNGLYRFLKTSNNYVCLGTCTTNTKYRIIGITDGSTTNTKLGLKSYQLKVIRNSVFANAVEWHNVKGADITWDQSTLFTYLNVTNKSKIIPSGWSNLISYVKWYNGVITSTAGSHETGALVAKSEMSSITSGTSQIGLMYRSDLFYSHIANGTYDCMDHPYCKDSWIPASSNNEWTMSRYRYDGSNSAGMIYSTEEYGRDGAYLYNFKFSVRPVFYLSTDVDYSGVGNGTSSNPFILS